MAQLKAEQEAFAEAAKKIDPNKPAIEVFKQVQSEHPTADKLIPDIAKDLDKIRKYVVGRKLVGIPSEIRPKVKETPQYLRATSFASMDTPGPFEKRATEAYYYVTPTEEDWPAQEKEEWLTAFNYYTSDVTSIHVLARPGHNVPDRDERRGVGSRYFVSRSRPENCVQYRSAGFDTADHHGRRAHQIRGHEPEPRPGLFLFALVFRTSELGKDEKNGEQATGATCLPVHRHALVVRRNDRCPGQAQSAYETPGSRS